MSVITVFSATYCHADTVVEKVAQRLGYRVIDSQYVLERASKRFGIPVDKLSKAMHQGPSIFNDFTRDKEKGTSYIKAAMASVIAEDDLVYHGFAGHLVPTSVDHVMKVALVASHDFREKVASEAGLSDKDARKVTAKDDEDRAVWTKFLFDKGPWDKTLYDLKIPLNDLSLDDAVMTICEKAQLVQTTRKSKAAVVDFATAAEAELALALEGHHDVDVTCRDGKVTVTINKDVRNPENLQDELQAIVQKVDKVTEIDIRVIPEIHEPYLYRSTKFDVPARVLLVDDEREFVQTLSERLRMREFGTAVANDGLEALSLIEDEEPEVMVLDLQMPGIGGIEVLRKVKAKRPNVEVIILTGHGTKKDAELAEQLGAFAYLEKPVDVDTLTKTMKAAYAKLRKKESGD